MNLRVPLLDDIQRSRYHDSVFLRDGTWNSFGHHAHASPAVFMHFSRVFRATKELLSQEKVAADS
jgi:hypothetical protein